MVKIIQADEVAEDADNDENVDDTSYMDEEYDVAESDDENIDEENDEDSGDDSSDEIEDDENGDESGDDSGDEEDFHRGEKFVDEVLTPIFNSYDTVDDDVKELFLQGDG